MQNQHLESNIRDYEARLGYHWLLLWLSLDSIPLHRPPHSHLNSEVSFSAAAHFSLLRLMVAKFELGHEATIGARFQMIQSASLRKTTIGPIATTSPRLKVVIQAPAHR
ncbi:hypothetical protein VNO77_27666 [Canavalia gladiata]|uniref:Uncharacterized protein n=1 Tax=Canavalia gladiata TaxID=3824 RepID=A0AAN9KZA0_CANGL